MLDLMTDDPNVSPY